MSTRFGRTCRKNLFLILYLNMKLKRMAKKKNKISLAKRHKYAMKFVRKYQKDMKINIHASGVEFMEPLKDKGCLIIGNHQGKSDAITILNVLGDYTTSFVIADYASHAFFFVIVCDAMEAERIDFNNLRSQANVYKEIAKDVSEENRKYIIFPEAGYKDNKNELQEFFTPSFSTAIKAKCPIVPVCLYDTWKIFNEDYQNKELLDVYCHILKPIDYEEYKGLNKKELSELVKSKIQDKLNEIRKG